MKDMKFGEIIEKLIFFSGEKNYTLAYELGYDVSYISKWISGTMLPTHKNIKIISSKIANFILENTDKSSKNEIIDYFNMHINMEKDDSNELLKVCIEDELNKSYLASRPKSNKKTVDKVGNDTDTTANNSVVTINPRYKKQEMDDDIMSYLKEDRKHEIIVLVDLFSLEREEKLHMIGIRHGLLVEEDIKNTKLRFLVNFDEKPEDIIFSSLLLINMVTNYSGIDFKIYSCNQSKYSVVVVAKDHSFRSIVYTTNKKCLFINTSNDKSIVEDTYNSLIDMKRSRSEIAFLEINHSELILNQIYMQYIIGRKLRWLIGNVNELLMPTDLFMELSEKVFGHDEKIMKELRHINAILQNIIENTNIQIIIYRNAIKNYILNGKLSFFNHTIELSLDQKREHLKYMKKLFEENKNIEVKLITDDLVADFKNMKNPSLFLSGGMNFIKINSEEVGKDNKYILIKDLKLKTLYNDFFEELWNIERNNITLTKEQAIDRISDLLRYINILTDITD